MAGKSTNSEIAVLQTQMDEVLKQLEIVNEKLDRLGDTFLTKAEFEAYKASLEPGNDIRKEVRRTAITALTYAAIIGFVLILVTYFNTTVLHIDK